ETGESWNQSRCGRRTFSNSHAADQIFESQNHPQSRRARCRSFACPQLLRSNTGRSRVWRMRFLSLAAQRLSRSRNQRSNSLREKMKRLFRIFELTKNEQRVVLIVMLILLTIAFVGYQRRVNRA